MLKALPPDSPDKSLAGDAAWLQVRTYAALADSAETPQMIPQQQGFNLPDQSNQAEPDASGASSQPFANHVPFPSRGSNPAFDAADYLAQLRAFLHDHPAHLAAPLAAEAIAQTIERQGKDAEAIAAWSDFIDAKAFQFDAKSEANRKQDPASGLTPAEALARRQQAAAFRIGRIHYNQRRYAEAIGRWRQYITAWPNGAEWQQAQSGIVDAEFQIGLTAVAAGDEAKAREVFDAFLSRSTTRRSS